MNNLDVVANLVEMGDFKSLFPIETRKEDYRPYFRSEKELQEWIDLPIDDDYPFNTAYIYKRDLTDYLYGLKVSGDIISIKRDEVEYRVITSRYEIYLRILHTGHVVMYTVNRKTNRKANYTKAYEWVAIKNNIERYL